VAFVTFAVLAIIAEACGAVNAAVVFVSTVANGWPFVMPYPASVVAGCTALFAKPSAASI